MEGEGLAHCDLSGVLVLSSTFRNVLCVFKSPGLDGQLRYLFTLGDGAYFAMKFDFSSVMCSGHLAFTGSADARHLLVADAGGGGTVHVIDVVYKMHAGYVAAPGTIAGPRCVAAKGALVAVSAWECSTKCKHIIQLYEGSGATWMPLRVLGAGFDHPGHADGQLFCPRGMRFSGEDVDDMAVVVADSWNDRVSMFRVRDGSFVRHLATDVKDVADVEEYENGWLCGSWGGVFVKDGVCTLQGLPGTYGCLPFASTQAFIRRGMRDRNNNTRIASIATVANVGLVVRRLNGQVQVFAALDALQMAAMRVDRVGWMAAVARGIIAN